MGDQCRGRAGRGREGARGRARGCEGARSGTTKREGREGLRVLVTQQEGGGNGAAISAVHLALGLAGRGATVRYVGPPGTTAARLAQEGGLPFHPVALSTNSRRDNRAAFRAILDAHPIDVINSQSSNDRHALTGLALRRQLPIPFVVTRRQMPRTSPVGIWLASRHAAMTIAVSRPVAEALVRRGVPANRIRIVPNGLITQRVDAPVTPAAQERWRARVPSDSAHRTIGIISRPKDQPVVLAALRQVHTPVRLILAGVPPGGAFADAIAAVPSRHTVVPIAFDPDIRPLYDLLEWLLLPSRMEGLSQALLEGMALGVPVIASAAGGNTDLIRAGIDGVLVPPLDPAAWAHAIEAGLASDEQARTLGAAGRRRARVDFALERTVSATLDVLGAVVTHGREG